MVCFSTFIVKVVGLATSEVSSGLIGWKTITTFWTGVDENLGPVQMWYSKWMLQHCTCRGLWFLKPFQTAVIWEPPSSPLLAAGSWPRGGLCHAFVLLTVTDFSLPEKNKNCKIVTFFSFFNAESRDSSFISAEVQGERSRDSQVKQYLKRLKYMDL